MLEDAEHDPRPSIQGGFAGEIERPDEILRHGAGPGAPDVFAHNLDFISVLADQLRDEGLAHRHAALRREAPVEDVRDGAAAGEREEGFEANDFPPDPFGLGRRAGKGSRWRPRAPVAERLLSE